MTQPMQPKPITDAIPAPQRIVIVAMVELEQALLVAMEKLPPRSADVDLCASRYLEVRRMARAWGISDEETRTRDETLTRVTAENEKLVDENQRLAAEIENMRVRQQFLIDGAVSTIDRWLNSTAVDEVLRQRRQIAKLEAELKRTQEELRQALESING